MRLLLATGLLSTLAFPAAAQRVDTRIDDVRPVGDGLSCRAHHHPDLQLVHGKNGEQPSASISYDAKESTGYDDLRMIIALRPKGKTAIETEGKYIGGEVTGFRLRTVDFPDAPVAEALLSLDGKPDPAKFQVVRKHRPPTFEIGTGDGGPLAERLVRAEKAELVLVDDARKVLGRFTWDVGRFRYAIELPILWGWRCDREY
jgi:hypothetical protein